MAVRSRRRPERDCDSDAQSTAATLLEAEADNLEQSGCNPEATGMSKITFEMDGQHFTVSHVLRAIAAALRLIVSNNK